MMFGDELEDFHFRAANVGLGATHLVDGDIDDNCRQDDTHDTCRQPPFWGDEFLT